MSETPPLSELEWAVLQTVVYADIFSYPLTLNEIHRYLIGSSANIRAVEKTLFRIDCLTELNGFYCLKDRTENVFLRRKRSRISKNLWSAAYHFGKLIGQIPFVRMVAVTGSLAVDNAEHEGDIDFMIVTQPGRLWLCRLFVIALVKIASKQGVTLCPNFFVSENELIIQDQNLFTARELCQMVPIVGMRTYRQMRGLNNWTQNYLPNAKSYPPNQTYLENNSRNIRKRLAELILKTPIGAWIDSWEMNRKIRKLTRQGEESAEVHFTKDTCKGHFDGHQRKIMTAFDERLRAVMGAQHLSNYERFRKIV
jgi:hypothetical protein